MTARELDPGFTEHVAAVPEAERVFVVLSGELVLGTSSGERPARARTVVFLPRGVGCRLSVTEPTRMLWIASTALPAGLPPSGAASDVVLTSIDDAGGVAMTNPAMGMFNIVTRPLVTSDTVTARAVLVGHSRFASNQGSHELHRHDRDEFMYVMSGTAHALSEEGESALKPGDLVYIPADEWHGLRAMEREEPSEHIIGYLGAASFAEAGYTLRG
ncbi:cupin domain-containing protein [Streptomyces sp. NPDC050287]|uniref:cupin domain-containing protein n=1 Tax=Streptomyces sp. NPDC050287 TaxID=3365608 RepID=UPI0037A9D6D7